jgi:hypothetical protein
MVDVRQTGATPFRFFARPCPHPRYRQEPPASPRCGPMRRDRRGRWHGGACWVARCRRLAGPPRRPDASPRGQGQRRSRPALGSPPNWVTPAGLVCRTAATTWYPCSAPPYHLTERQDRLSALREAARVARPGAVLLRGCREPVCLLVRRAFASTPSTPRSARLRLRTYRTVSTATQTSGPGGGRRPTSTRHAAVRRRLL